MCVCVRASVRACVCVLTCRARENMLDTAQYAMGEANTILQIFEIHIHTIISCAGHITRYQVSGFYTNRTYFIINIYVYNDRFTNVLTTLCFHIAGRHACHCHQNEEKQNTRTTQTTNVYIFKKIYIL